MADRRLPETPFNGVIVARDVSQFADAQNDPKNGTKISLLIIAEDDHSELPETVSHSFVVSGKTQPWIFLREGHKVRIMKVEDQNGFNIVTHFSLNDREIAAAARTALNKGKSAVAKEVPSVLETEEPATEGVKPEEAQKDKEKA